MSAGGPELVVRVSANLSELKSALTQGVTQFETTRSALNSMSNAFDGSRTLAQAGAVVGAIMQIGDVTKLTAAEQAKANTILEAGLAKYQALGREAPPGMRELAAATKQADESTFSWSGTLGKASGILAAFGITASIGAIVNLGKALLDDADALTKMHDKTGISVEGLQAMRAAGDDAGVGLDAMTASVNMLQKRLGGDDESANKALRDLGINIETFKHLDGAQQMDAISNAIQGMDDPLRVANDLSALFGKQWAEQLPVLKRGFQELHDGTVQMSGGTVKVLDDWGDAMARLWRSAKANMGEALADVLTLSLSADRRLNSEVATSLDLIERAASGPGFGALAPPGLPKDLAAIEAGFKADAQAMKELAEMTKVMAEIEKTTFGLAMDHQKQWREEIEKTKEARNRAVVDGLNSIKQAESDLRDVLAKQALSSTDYQIMKINERADAEIASFKGTAEQRAAFTAATITLADQEAQALRDAANSSAVAATKAADAAEIAAKRQVAALAQVTQGYYQEIDAAMALLAITGMDSSTGKRTTTPNDGTNERGPGINQGFTTAINGVTAAVAFKVPSHKDGGPTVEGPAYVHDNEYVVPERGALVMRGDGGSSVANITNIYLDGRVIASVVNDHNTRSVRQARQFPSA